VRRKRLRLATACLLLFAARASAQTRPADAPARDAQPAATAQTRGVPSASADEEFDLNIDQRRINEGDYHAETSVSTGDARGLRLNVGVALRASDIDVLLRNVRGHVRFRASLDPVLRLLDAHRDAAPRRQSAPVGTPP
jgi:hypothetical protein